MARKISAFGVLGPLKEGEEIWDSYIERVQRYLASKTSTAKIKYVPFFSNHSIIKAKWPQYKLLALSKLTEKTLEHIAEIVSAHVNPKPIEVAERCKFNNVPGMMDRM